MEKEKKHIDTVLDNFRQITNKPEAFLNADDSKLNKIKVDLKEAYDYCKREENKVKKLSALPELIIKNFDLEQIWQQLELQNESILSQSITNVSKLIVGKSQLIFDSLKKELESNDNSKTKDIIKINDAIEVEKDINEDNSSNSDSDEELELNDDDLNENISNSDGDDEHELNDVDDEKAVEPETVKNAHKKSKKQSVVDDDFFKLEEMEKFVNDEEKKIQNSDKRKDSEESDDESEHSVDLFKEELDDKLIDESDDDNARIAKFKDFFVSKDDGKKTKRNKFLEDASNDGSSGDENEIKSTLELRQERLKRKIQELEQNAVTEKPWQLKGEIRAEDRPHNSLLEEIVEFDLTSRPAPIITEQTTLQLEDIIKQRIKDHVFDSVERKVKIVDTPLEYKKKLVLDQEKSKQSLAQIYEKEFLDQQAALDPENADKEEEEPELHKDIKNLMKNLFHKLDALSNFHYTPKPAIPELKIVNNLPAITIEEVGPNSISNAALLAPEEVKNKSKAEIIAKSERTTTDKNRERRKKKKKQRAHLKAKQSNAANKLRPGLGNKYSTQKAKDVLNKVMKDKNVDKMDESAGTKAVKSSKAFFTQLQEEVHAQINGKLQNKRKKKKEEFVAKKIKL